MFAIRRRLDLDCPDRAQVTESQGGIRSKTEDIDEWFEHEMLIADTSQRAGGLRETWPMRLSVETGPGLFLRNREPLGQFPGLRLRRTVSDNFAPNTSPTGIKYTSGT